MDYLCFGEILFDILSGQRKLGGAPLNVAAHLAKLGFKGSIVSSVGDDDLGNEAITSIKKIGIDSSLISISSKKTGRADITLKDGDADYIFNDDSAWDNIPKPKNLPKHVGVIYFGTLAQRSALSRKTLEEILSFTEAEEVFFDVNLRKQYYSREIIVEGLRKATILKMNEEEVPIIEDILGIKERDIDKASEEISRQYSIPTVIVTLGKNGAQIFRDGSWCKREAEAKRVVDTVGAGDSLSAGIIGSLLKGLGIKKALEIGSHIAAYVVSEEGAIPEYDEELRKYLFEEGFLA